VVQQAPAEARPIIIQSMAQQLGIDPEAFVRAASATPEALETVRNRKAAEGAAGVPASEVASVALTGQNQGQLAESNVASQFLGTQGKAFGPVGEQAFLQSLARRGGQSLGGMAVDQQVAGLGQNPLRNAAAMSLGLMPTAVQAEQLAQGRTGLGIQQSGLGIQQQNTDISRMNMMGQYGLGFRELEGKLKGAGTWAPSTGGAGGVGQDDWLRAALSSVDALSKGGLDPGREEAYRQILTQAWARAGLGGLPGVAGARPGASPAPSALPPAAIQPTMPFGTLPQLDQATLFERMLRGGPW
jgi:hypothetical protein